MHGEDTSLTSGPRELIDDRMTLRDTAPIKSVQTSWMIKVEREGYIPQHHILVNMSKGWSKLLRHGPQDTRHPIHRLSSFDDHDAWVCVQDALTNYNWYDHARPVRDAVMSLRHLAENDQEPELIAILYAMTQVLGKKGEKKCRLQLKVLSRRNGKMDIFIRASQGHSWVPKAEWAIFREIVRTTTWRETRGDSPHIPSALCMELRGKV